MRTVLADYIGIIPSRVGKPLGFEIHLVGENIAAKSAEGTKRVRAVKDPVQRVISNHGFRPMDHWSHNKRERMRASIKDIAFLDQNRA